MMRDKAVLTMVQVLVWGQWRLGKRAGGGLLRQDHLATSRL
jgi:hypothetical protein